MGPPPVGFATATRQVPAGAWLRLTTRGDEPRAVLVTELHVTDRVSRTVPDHVNVACSGPPPATVHVAETVPDPKFSGPGLGPGTVDALVVLELPVVPMTTDVDVVVDVDAGTDVDVTGAGAEAPGGLVPVGALVLVPTPGLRLPCPDEPGLPASVEPWLAVGTPTGGAVPLVVPGGALAPGGALVGVACGWVLGRLECPRAAVTTEDPVTGRSPAPVPFPAGAEPVGAAGSPAPGAGRVRAATRAISARATARTAQPRGRVIDLLPGSLPRRTWLRPPS